MSPSTRAFLAGAVEAAAVVLAIAAFGLAWAAAERRAVAGAASYPGAVESDATEPLPPASIWLVDGYNVLHAGMLRAPDRRDWWTAPQRDRLLTLLDGFCRRQQRPVEVWVVFDGDRPGPGPSQSPGSGAVYPVFAPSADRWIVQRVRSSSDPDRLAVVTGDRQVGDRARHRGAHVVSPRRFLQFCG